MTRRITHQTVSAPTLFITRGKQRVKQHGKTVYLNDGDEFELELFNPLQKKVLAKISLNGKELGAGLILRPGERIFLERYLDEARKFEFSTYFVDGNDINVQKAIEKNGKVDVEFYQEYEQISYTLYNNPNWYTDNSPNIYYSGDVTYTSGDTTNISFSSSVDTVNLKSSSTPISQKKEKNMKETGRVEKGSFSDQKLEYDNTSFHTYPSWTDNWTIKPKSQKVYTKEEIVIYCTKCGTKRKKTNWKFCPACGAKY